MGRKIPGKKHRGIKDPYAQHAKRLASLKVKINKTPTDLDDQPVPKTLTRLLSWKNKDRNGLIRDPERKKKPEKAQKGLTKVVKKHAPANNPSTNPVNKLKKIAGESNKSFNMRINDAMRSLKSEKGFDDVQNETALEPKEKKMNEDGYPIFIHKKGKKRRPLAKQGEVFLTKSQKRTQKEKLKKDKLKEEKELDKQYIVQKDDIKFGEIVHEPPTLNIKPRKAEKTTGVPRPARKDLLLNKLFEKSGQTKPQAKSSKANITTYPKKTEGVIDLKGKRKDLPQNVRRKIEQSQREAIEAYKMIKLEKMRSERKS